MNVKNFTFLRKEHIIQVRMLSTSRSEGDRMSEKKLKARGLYLSRLISFADTELIKVITGIRRCGKSSLLKLFIEYLKDRGVDGKRIVEVNFESMANPNWDDRSLYSYIKERVIPGEKMYLFFDEIQLVPDWQRAINSFRVDFDCDIYITGSNAYLLSSELSTFLSGRYVEIKMLPLSFSEFVDFQGFSKKEKLLPDGGTRKQLFDQGGEMVDARDVFDAYVKYGGMPSVTEVELNQETVSAVLDGIYSTVIVRDILERGKFREQRSLTDPVLLRKLVMFLADSIGNSISANSISNTLISEKLIDSKPAVRTVQTYMAALAEAYVFYEIKRFDIKGKEYLRTLGKHYIVDVGLRNYLLGFRGGDRGHILENIVFFELLRRGYQVAVGKIDNREIDFIATRTDEKAYIQVTETMSAQETRERELTPLQTVKDNFEKLVISLDRPLTDNIEGIHIVNALDWLLQE